MTKKNIAVIFGGRSVEHEVSVITGIQTIENMNREKYNPIPVFIDKEGKWYTGDQLLKFNNFKEKKLSEIKEVYVTPIYNDRKLHYIQGKIGIFGKKEEPIALDAVFIALHGTNGEDGTIQGLFELMNIPYVSAGVLGSSVGMDKILMKDVYKSHKLPIVDYTWFFRQEWKDDKESVIKKIESKLKYPLFIKPSNLGSSVGITKANNVDDLKNSIDVAVEYDRKVIVEESVESPREINCAVLGYDNNVRASLCEEPIGWKELLTYEDKYINSNSKNSKSGRNIPADLTDEQSKNIQELAKEAFTSIDCRGVARIDFLMDTKENIYINEINTQPGSIAYYLWEPMGMDFSELTDTLIEDAYLIHSEKNKNMYSYDIDLFDKVNLESSSKLKENKI